MPFVEYFLLRLVVWIGLLSALVALAVGPRKLWRGIKRIWTIAWRKRLDPQEILTQVVQQHQQHVKAVRVALGQAETAEEAIRENLRQSQEHLTSLDAEAKRLTIAGDELGARAALYKINLERMAIENFGEQLERQCRMVTDSRHRLYMLELQLRQYEVGRSILLSQLAQAEKVEEQYAIARRFDPFNAVANWQKAEGLVQEKSLNARAIERVYADTSELAAPGSPPTVDPVVLEAQLAQLRAQLTPTIEAHNGPPAPPKPGSENSKNQDSIPVDPLKPSGLKPSEREKPS
jgi:phage shock protein A